MNAAKLSQTPLGRAALHVVCLWRNSAAARFHLVGFKRNLRVWREQHLRR
jgi:hypothetical protein